MLTAPRVRRRRCRTRRRRRPTSRRRRGSPRSRASLHQSSSDDDVVLVARDRDEVGRLREVAVQPAPDVAERLAVGVAGAFFGIGRAEVRERVGRRDARRAQVDLVDRRRLDRRRAARRRSGPRSSRPSSPAARGSGPAPSTPQPQNRRFGSRGHARQSSRSVGVALVDEGLAQLVAVAPEVELEREALLGAVRALHVDRIDLVQRLLGPAHHDRALRRDRSPRSRARRRTAASRGTTRSTVPNASSSCAVIIEPVKNIARSLCCGTKRARWVATPSAPRSTSGRPKVASSEATTMSALPGEPDAAAEAEAVHRRDHRHLAVVDRAERLVAAAVDLHEALVGRVGGELLDVDAGLEALALGAAGSRRARRGRGRRRAARRRARTSPRPGSAFTGGLSMVTVATCARVSERITRGSLCEDAAMNARIDELLGELTLDEKAAMVAGVDLWHTAAVPRLGIPALKVTDGPAGARGERWTGRASASFPCGTALGATWNPELVRTVGERIGGEARRKGAHVLLAPTVNIHRHPLAGRNFECYSEDPYLSARMAVEYITGVQSTGVGCSVKHFVANDSEFERMTISSEVDDAHAARDLARAVRGGGARSGHVVGDGGVQPSARHVLQRAPAARRAAEGRVGLRRRDHVGLVRHAQHGAGRERRPRPRDAGPGAVVRRAPRRRGARRRGRRGRRSTTRCGGCSLLLDRTGGLDTPDSGPEQSIDDPEDRAVARRAAAESFVLLQQPRRDAADRRDAASGDAAAARGDRPERGGRDDPGRRERARVAVPAGHAARRPARALRRRVPRRARARLLELQADAGARHDRARRPACRSRTTRAASAAASPCSSSPATAAGSRSPGRSRPRCPQEFSMRITGHARRARDAARGRSASCRSAGPACRSTARSWSTTGSRPGRSEAFMGFASAEVTGTIDLVAGEPHALEVEYVLARPVDGRAGDRVHAARAAPTCSSARSRSRRAPTWSCAWSAPTATGRPRATTASRWRCRRRRTSSCARSRR